MNQPVVAVVGAGNVGCALAAHLALRGLEVRLCTRSDARLAGIRDAGAITLTGSVEGSAMPALLTTSVADALAGADVVAVTVPTTALPAYAGPLAASVTDGQVLWLDPGHSGGALYLAAEIERRTGRRGLRICQLSTASHGSRMSGPATVGVFRLSPAVLAAFPARHLDECRARIDALLPGQFSTAATVLELDLLNPNAVMHPAQMIGNAGWIEAAHGAFRIYRDGTGPALGRVMDAVDAERRTLAEHLGVPTTPFVEFLHHAGYTTAEAARAGLSHPALQAGEAFRDVAAPPTLDHRYLHEDVGWGLVPWMELADAVDVRTPTMSALTCLAGVMNGIDYRAVGLTLEQMGLGGMPPELIATYARTGEHPG